jgi:hypothetical protein
MVWWLRGGASIETNLNYPRARHTAAVRQGCRVADACPALPLAAAHGGYVEASSLDAYLSGKLD